MPTNQMGFFATRTDLEELLRAIEAKRKLRYVEVGLFDEAILVQRESFSEIPDLGVANRGDANQEPAFLVADRRSMVQVRAVQQRSGGTKFAIDQVSNPHTIAFRPGGTFADAAVIAGQVGTVSDDAESLGLFKLFAAEIRRRFTKIGSYYVGKDAGALLGAGYRLTASVRAPPLYDLRR